MRKAKILKAKEPIKLRFKKLANGNQSIFLEQYTGYKTTEAGKVKIQKKYEFLNLYLIPELTPADKITNENTLQLANTIKAKRIVKLQEQQTGLTTRKKSKINLIDFINKVADKSLAETKRRNGDYHNYKSLARHLKAYRGECTLFSDIDKAFIIGFIDYLKTAKNGNFEKREKQPTISKNGQHKLFAKFSTIIRMAVISEIISSNPLDKIDLNNKPKGEPSKREYLTIPEIKKLIATDCKRPVIKNAFLFCCLVGIRFSNAKNLVWGDIDFQKSGAVLKYKQVKVDKYEYLPISEAALKYLPTDTDINQERNIFSLPKNETVNDNLKVWIKSAGISKTITFHSSRHTAATLQLSLGTPIETVSKLLGHSKIATTQIYAKIIDKSKVEAVNKQNEIF